MQVNFEQNRMVQTTRNFELFDKKRGFFYYHFWQRVDAILENVPVGEIIFYAKLLIQRLSSFSVQKLRHPDTCNQVKSCTKRGRPDQSQRELTVALNAFKVYRKAV